LDGACVLIFSEENDDEEVIADDGFVADCGLPFQWLLLQQESGLWVGSCGLSGEVIDFLLEAVAVRVIRTATALCIFRTGTAIRRLQSCQWGKFTGKD